jgi:hypothetical protein
MRPVKLAHTPRRPPFGLVIELSRIDDDYTTATAATLRTWLSTKFGDNQHEMCGTSVTWLTFPAQNTGLLVMPPALFVQAVSFAPSF